MKNIKTFESFLNEAKEFSFTFDYNTDDDDIEYIQNILKKAGVNATAEADIDSELMLVKAANAIELRKAKKAIEADGFEINESVVNESTSVSSLTKFYSASDKSVTDVAKEIDGIIDMAGFNINTKNELLTLITDLTDAYLQDMRDA